MITNINNTKRELEGIRQTAIKNNTTLGEAYRKKADDLAKYLAQYNFYQKYGVGKVTEISTQYNNNGIREDKNGNSISYWNYERNNFFVKYQTADNKIYTGYFDWVAVKEKKDVYGNTLKDVKGNVLYEYTPYWETNPLKVDQIMVIEKAPIYSDDDWYNQGRKFYYYEDSNGIHAYFSKKDITYWDSTSGRYKHQPDFKEIESFNKNDIRFENGDTIEFRYEGNWYTFKVKKTLHDKHEYPYFGQVQDDLNIDGNNYKTIKGKSYFSIKDFGKQQTKYDKQRSEFTSVSERQSRHKSDSVENSLSKSKSLSLSTSNSNSKSNVDTSDSLSKSTSLSAENSDIESRSISHSLLESTEIATSQSTSTSVSDSQSTSTSVSSSQSTSTSVSESQSTSTSVSSSQSTSTSVSDSQSTSTSVSSSQSTSTSVSESQSTSTSVSDSQSTSTSASENESTSESVSTSESTSASSSESESLSTSESESTSASLSESESTSTSESLSASTSESQAASDSFATSVTTTTTGGDTSYRRVVVDTRAPLQVAPRETEEVVEDETPKANPEKQTETIEKEKMPKSTLDVTHRVWWSWIPIVGALVSMNETRKRRKEEKEEESKDKKLK